jgi:hypothetical protein
MEARAMFSWPMMGSGFCGFSANLVTRLVSSVVMMPNSLARSSGTSTTPTVMSASHCSW